jgi:hypothetical protein
LKNSNALSWFIIKGVHSQAKNIIKMLFVYAMTHIFPNRKGLKSMKKFPEEDAFCCF